jgi:hypothetical protein
MWIYPGTNFGESLVANFRELREGEVRILGILGNSANQSSRMFKVASDLSGAAASTPQGHGGTAPASAHGDSLAAVAPLCIGEKGVQVRNIS